MPSARRAGCLPPPFVVLTSEVETDASVHAEQRQVVVTVLKGLPDPRPEVALALARPHGLAEVARGAVVEAEAGVLYLDGNKEDALMTGLDLARLGRDRAGERRQSDGESEEQAAEHGCVGDGRCCLRT